MFKNVGIEKSIWGWRWPLIVVVVIAGLVGLQILRANRPRPVPAVTPVVYSSPGPLAAEEIVIDGLGYHSTRLELNRRMKIHGTFRTQDLDTLVEILILSDKQFESWKLGLPSEPIVRTGNVPGGKISPVLEPGIYHLVIDNGSNATSQTVKTNFGLE